VDGSDRFYTIFTNGEKMKNKTLQKFLLAIALPVFLGGLFAGGVHAANTAKMEDGRLGKLHAGRGIECAECHEDAKNPETPSMLKCVDCHGETTKLAEKTANAKPRNPHENRHYGTEADCNLCHHQHKKSENFCLPCHQRFDFVVP
jgi:hypothetical protein